MSVLDEEALLASLTDKQRAHYHAVVQQRAHKSKHARRQTEKEALKHAPFLLVVAAFFIIVTCTASYFDAEATFVWCFAGSVVFSTVGLTALCIGLGADF